MSEDLKQLQSEFGISFNDQRLLKQAFTHTSYVNEHRNAHHKDNERLEFLGDAVLELSVSEYLYYRYPNLPEGELTKLRASIVCEPSLFKFAVDLDFGSYILLGKGEELTGGRSRPALLADVFEAFIGALYLDQGLKTVRHFLNQRVFSRMNEEAPMQVIDFKTRLQEYTQHHNLGTLDYRVVDERGPAHDKEFVTEVYTDGQMLGKGSGRSKKESEQQAAAQALQALNVSHS